MVGKAYEEELKRYEDDERAVMAEERLRIHETVRTETDRVVLSYTINPIFKDIT